MGPAEASQTLVPARHWVTGGQHWPSVYPAIDVCWAINIHHKQFKLRNETEHQQRRCGFQDDTLAATRPGSLINGLIKWKEMNSICCRVASYQVMITLFKWLHRFSSLCVFKSFHWKHSRQEISDNIFIFSSIASENCEHPACISDKIQ